MVFVRLILKLLVMPVILCLWMLKWIGQFLLSMASWMIYLAASLIFLMALIFPIFGVSTWGEVIPLFVVSFLFYAIPNIGEWLVEVLAMVGSGLGEFVRK